MEEERPQEGGERIILEMDSEEDPEHEVRGMEALETGAGEHNPEREAQQREGRFTPLGHPNQLGVPRT